MKSKIKANNKTSIHSKIRKRVRSIKAKLKRSKISVVMINSNRIKENINLNSQ